MGKDWMLTEVQLLALQWPADGWRSHQPTHGIRNTVWVTHSQRAAVAALAGKAPCNSQMASTLLTWHALGMHYAGPQLVPVSYRFRVSNEMAVPTAAHHSQGYPTHATLKLMTIVTTGTAS